MPVFRTRDGKASQLTTAPFSSEKELQKFFEANLEELLGVRFVATEFRTGERHGGRIDTLGLDEEGNPVIVEYKWDKSDSVMNQGLFYLDWLLDHRGDFELAVQKTLAGASVSWDSPRLILVAATYTKYDTYAVNQLQPSIELLRYQRYSDGTFVLDAVNEPISTKRSRKPAASGNDGDGTTPEEFGLAHHQAKTTDELWAAFLDLRERLLALSDVEERSNQKSQITYRTTRSFAACDFNTARVLCQFKGGEDIDDPQGRAQDIRRRGWGYEWAFALRTQGDVDYAFRLLSEAYQREQ